MSGTRPVGRRGIVRGEGEEEEEVVAFEGKRECERASEKERMEEEDGWMDGWSAAKKRERGKERK